MRSIMFVGISFRATKFPICAKGVSSTKSPMRLPSNPLTDMRDALPIPPVFRTVTPTVRANTSLMLVAVPCSWRCEITDTGIAPSRIFLASLRAVTVTSCSVCSSGISTKSSLMLSFPKVFTCFISSPYPTYVVRKRILALFSTTI